MSILRKIREDLKLIKQIIWTLNPRFLINEGDCDKVVLWGRSGFDADYKTSGACRDGGESRKIKVTTL